MQKARHTTTGWPRVLGDHPYALAGLALAAAALAALYRPKGSGASGTGNVRIAHGGPRPTRPSSVGLSTGLQPGGTIPGRSPALGMGSIGTGGGSTASVPTGAAAEAGPAPR